MHAHKEQEALDAGADFVGLDDYIKKIKEGWTDVDVVITMLMVSNYIQPESSRLKGRGWNLPPTSIT